jgi:hypothetical protein
VHGHALPARGRRAGEQHRLAHARAPPRARRTRPGCRGRCSGGASPRGRCRRATRRRSASARRSPVLIASTPWPSSVRTCSWNQLVAPRDS